MTYVFAVFIVLFLVVSVILKSPWGKGKLGEFIVNLSTRLFLDKATYHLVKNITLPTEDGTTQIDHVIVSRHGIFVVETKNMGGAIYGGEGQRQWTQAFGPNKYRFQNPLHQNYKHTRTLAEILGVPHETIKSVIVFVGNAKLKTKDKLPPNVMDRGLVVYIKSHQEEVLAEEQVQQVLAMIEDNRLARGLRTDREHVNHVRDIKAKKQVARISSERTETPSLAGAPPPCAKCGETMVLRTAKRGPNAGSRFWGCPRYPKCRTMVKIDSSP